LSLLLHRIDSRTGPSNGDDTSVACQSLLVSRFDIEIPLDIDAPCHSSDCYNDSGPSNFQPAENVA
ncbi:hypothetical protein, partial [Roseiconus lacunae]|uniref:hypothetical protein n=1 Tax=Roseiconus lacunae TaxID=2605694 RepID=UPI00193F4396